jgi:pyruvyl transferase EpsO
MAGDDPVALCSTILHDRLASFLGNVAHAAMLGFPENQDCGDHANWLGAVKLLSELGIELSYESSWQSVQPDTLSAMVGDCAVLMANAFSAATGPESVVAKTIRSLTNRTLLLPERLRADRTPVPSLSMAIAAHPDLCVLAREGSAAKAIARGFAENPHIELAPPLSFLLGAQQRKTDPQYDLVWVARTGRKDGSVETAARLSSQSAEKLDLPDFADGLEIDIVAKCRPPTVMLTDWSSLVFRTQESRIAYGALGLQARAQAYVQRGLYILSLGRLVITDRVGAHILCLLLGQPHVFVDDGAGTNRSFFETWTRAAQSCRFADTPARAWTSARAMLRAMSGE